MQPFAYERPETLAEAVHLLEAHGPAARLLAGGTDLIVGLRQGEIRPRVVIDSKWIADLLPAIHLEGRLLVIGAQAVMTDIAANPEVRRCFPALVEAANVVGSVQIRNRATLAGNVCNASPAADTLPPLLVYGAIVVIAGPTGARRIPLDAFLVGPGRTVLAPGELVTAIELPIPEHPTGAAYTRLTRRRGTDLASVTLAAAVDGTGVVRVAYGSVGPRALLVSDETGVLADAAATPDDRAAALERLFVAASPSARSLRAGPEYRLAMLRVLGERAVQAAVDRLRDGAAE